MSALHPIEAKKKKGIGNIAAHAVIYLYTLIALLPQLYVIYTSFLKSTAESSLKGSRSKATGMPSVILAASF